MVKACVASFNPYKLSTRDVILSPFHRGGDGGTQQLRTCLRLSAQMYLFTPADTEHFSNANVVTAPICNPRLIPSSDIF